MDKKRFEVRLCFEMYESNIWIFDLWLLISEAADDYFCFFYLYLTLLLSNYFYLFINIRKALWPNRQGKRLLTYGTSKNVGSKPATGGWTLASKRGLDI